MNKIAYNRILEAYMTNDELKKTNPVIYSNDLFEIHLDDLYIRNDDTFGYIIMVDMSKIFRIKMSKYVRYDTTKKYEYLKNKFMNIKFLPINYVHVFMEYSIVNKPFTITKNILQNFSLSEEKQEPSVIVYGENEYKHIHAPFSKDSSRSKLSVQKNLSNLHTYQKPTKIKPKWIKKINHITKYKYRKTTKLKDFLLQKICDRDLVYSNTSAYSICTIFNDYTNKLINENNYGLYHQFIHNIINDNSKQGQINFAYYIFRKRLISKDLKINTSAYKHMDKFTPSQNNEFCYKQFYEANKLCYNDITSSDFFEKISKGLEHMFYLLNIIGKKNEKIIIKYLETIYLQEKNCRIFVIEWK